MPITFQHSVAYSRAKPRRINAVRTESCRAVTNGFSQGRFLRNVDGSDDNTVRRTQIISIREGLTDLGEALMTMKRSN